MFKKLFGKSPKAGLEALHFKDNQAAFLYACEYLINERNGGGMIVAMVEQTLDHLPEFSPAHPDNHGRQTAMVKVAGKSGGTLEIAACVRANETKIRKGDLVAWQLHGGHGIILGLLDPVYDLKRGWKVREGF